jgi:hypothetical protein
MPSTFTNSLRLVLPATGELSNTWGTVFNAGATSLIDTSIAGTASITMTAANYTLSNANGVADESRAMFIVLGGTPGASYQVICPAVSKLYFVTNNTGFAQTFKTSAGSGISVPNGARIALRCDGTDVLEALTYFGSLTLGTALATASGGTGLTTFTAANNAIYSTSASALTAGTLPIAAGGTGATTLAGANIPVVNAANTFTELQTFSGSTSVAAAKLTNAKEVATVSATAATGTIAYDVTTQSVLYYTSNASANWTVNFRGSSGTSLDTLMSTGESITAAFLVTQGSTAYYNSAVQVDGASVTPKWQGGTAPTSGNASGVDAYTYTIIKTASATFTVLAAQTQFK